MQIEMYGMQFDLNDEIDCMFLHDRIIYEKYKNLRDFENETDILTKVYRRDVVSTLQNKVKTGGWFFAADDVYQYNDEIFENVSEDFTMCWKKTETTHDTLVIHLTSYAGHEGRLTNALTNVSERVINLETDLLIVNEDPLRMPETLYPSMMVLGCSAKNDTLEKMCVQIRNYIKKEYKNVILFADSKHAGIVLSIAYQLSDIVTNVLTTGGQSTYSWENSPWIKSYFKWYNRPEHLKNQHLDMIDVARMYLVKCWKFKQLGIDNKILDPYRYISEYPNIKVHYVYGKYDSEYLGFNNYVKKFECDNLQVTELDFKISESQRHNIRPYVDKKILPEYIKNLPKT